MRFKSMIFLILGALLIYGLYCVALFWNAARKSAPLIKATAPFTREDPSFSKSILVIGDSLAAGVGAPSEKTVAGRLGIALNANVANFAKSGAHTSDLLGQLALAQKSHYDLILIQIGANDVIQLQSLAKAEANMDAALSAAEQKTDKVVFLTSGNIGDAPLWPFPWPYIYKKRTLDLRERFRALAQKHNSLYIDLYARGNLFAQDPGRYYAPDQLHVTADGYGKWFDVVYEEIVKRWGAFAR